MNSLASRRLPALSTRGAFLALLIAIGCFQIAFLSNLLAFVLVGYFGGLLALSHVPDSRWAFGSGFAVGFANASIGAAFFWNIFGGATPVLWAILGLFSGAFVWGMNRVHRRWGVLGMILVAPVLWLGLEWLRAEGYYLRFSWLSPGYALAYSPQSHVLMGLGIYSFGAILCFLTALTFAIPGMARVMATCFLTFGLFLFSNLPTVTFGLKAADNTVALRVTGAHVSALDPESLVAALDRARAAYPETDLFVLGEYVFSEDPPKAVRAWCRTRQAHVIAGGVVFTDRGKPGAYENTAMVVDPQGQVVFTQVKSVPIQFFDDGVPAQEQQVWESPWGPIGIAVCYDLSFRSVTDVLVRQGALALIVPCREDVSWGTQQLVEHGRVAPIRSSEYRFPVVRVGAERSNAQICDANGRIVAFVSHQEQDAVLSEVVALSTPGRVPGDHWLGPLCMWGALVVLIVVESRVFFRATSLAASAPQSAEP